MKEKYDELLRRFREVSVISQIAMLTGWDTEVMMPKGGIEQRGNQQAFLARLIHGKITDPEIGKLLQDIKNDSSFEKLSLLEKRNIYLIQRDYDKQTKLPADFVGEYTKVRVIAVEKWKEARRKNDFALFQPFLEKVFELTKEYTKYLNPDLPSYEVLLDDYEPGMSVESYNKIFDPLKEATVDLIEKCKTAAKQPDKTLILRKVPIDIQEKISGDLMSRISYDLDRGRLDTAAHPFTTGAYDDVRITTRYIEDDFTSSLFAVMHEGGHGCYEQNLPKELRYQPVGNYCSMGLHESQSRFYENTIGRSKSFWFYYLPKFKELTGSLFGDVEYDDFLHAINRVEPSLIRVEADEVTYNLHIILRFELERDLFEGKIEISDLPHLWKDKMKETLGIPVETDSDGVLQDIHWSGGSFGYFPTYSLGNLYAAQFFAKLVEDIPDWNVQLEKGNVQVLTDWMKKNVQEKGNFYDPPELVKEVTGEYPNPKYLIEFLNKKYSEIYGF
ncbi:MAG: carboxypeptidase M32 [Candidatus Heimdallarchaeota archaeon]|nr:carboxypeptidase M32 [Candidatus Heimdallarchaeota archaeon]MCK4876206.1 carboxypeptidase M32 [Candidatus Heimdallarchaeota archaeon]